MKYSTNDFKDISLLSSRIHRYAIYEENNKVCIDLYCELAYPQGMSLKVVFKDVKEYSFYWNSNYYHNYIENLKYIQCDGLHYISFDPDETVDTISESDNDFIYCSEIVLEK